MSDFHCLPHGHLLQHYRIEKVLGEGGFALTYLAVDTLLDKRVVIKENYPASLADRRADGSVSPPPGEEEVFRMLLDNFLEEARMLANFEHPNIVPVHAYFEANDTAYFVMPFLDGISLKEVVARRGERGLSLAEYLSLLTPLLDALDTLHQGKTGPARTAGGQMAIYHRDIKPDNILVVEEEYGKWTPVLIDFGSARDLNAYRNTRAFQNTIRYKSGAFTPPEFTENDRRTIGPSSDLFSLGATVFSCITRDPLHDRAQMGDLTEEPEWVANYGEDFLGLIMDSIELSVNDRPRNSAEWRRRLERSHRAMTEGKAGEDLGKAASVGKPAWPRWIAVVLAVVPVTVLWVISHHDSPDPESSQEKGRVHGTGAGEERVFAGITFRWCPAGTFTMGTPETEPERVPDETLHQVTLTRGFWLAKYECTQAQWEQVSGHNPSHFEGDRKPVESITWEDTRQYLERLNHQGGLPAGWEFRLPTEAEWEYACRAGTRTVFSFGDRLNGIEANCNGEVPYGIESKGPNLEGTVEVGSYSANPWGLHDMHGNVEEFCNDWYVPVSEDPARDPTGGSSGTERVGRGGSWRQPGEGCRAGKRGRYKPHLFFNSSGFRVALCPRSD